MRYVSSRINIKTTDDIYRFYVTNALKILTSNTARFAGGSELTKTYRDIISPSEDEQEEEQDGDAQAQEIIAKMKSKIAKVRG